ncbi:MAG: alpha-amylase [Myxococcales bacterium FL481]|nr:MAG: alpha-amylase [Myxococcales bacterium FL481]
MQYFHWYYPADGSLWRRVTAEVPQLAKLGITALWLPPAYKGPGGANDVGYGAYDLYDLGEFDQHGTIRTKYGTKEEYTNAIAAAHAQGIQVYADVVLNHRGGADGKEWVRAAEVHEHDRQFVVEDELWIEAWTRFTFPGRRGKYSDFTWSWRHFDGVNRADNLDLEREAIFKFLSRGKDWEKMVSGELGNYDYLMHSDIDMNSPDVRTELMRWGKWFLDTTHVDGFRLDAVKHIQFSFFRDFLDSVRRHTGKEVFAVGEYWNPNSVEELIRYIEHTGQRLSLFDAPLHRRFHEASRSGGHFDMRQIFHRTLVQSQPTRAVTLVDNHDTQPCQSLESPVEPWFKPLAYAIICLWRHGYPCVFYPDLYGAEYEDNGRQIVLEPVPELPLLLRARRQFAYGPQHSFIDHSDVIGWTREGDDAHPGSGLAVVLSDGPGAAKWMHVGRRNAGRRFRDLLDRVPERVTVNADGWGEFGCEGGSVSVWGSE